MNEETIETTDEPIENNVIESKFNRLKYNIAGLAILMIGTIQMVALSKNINGMTISVSCSAICGIAGYFFGRRQNAINNS